MQPYALYLVKVGEILLKIGNRREFEERLKTELKRRLAGIPHKVEYSPGRFFVAVLETRAAEAEAILASTPGVNGFARARRTEKNLEAVAAAALEVARTEAAAGGRTFKVESRRSDKSFPLESFALSAELGSRILDAVPGLKVDLHHPDFVVTAEVREKAYVYGNPRRGQRGLPVGTQGRGLLLLSGGIDSPVAGYLMARRGLALDAVYFHAYPYTSKEAHEKVIELAKVVSRYAGPLVLWTVPFTESQLEIKKKAREDLTTLMMRTAMVELADSLARRVGANCLVTGESLGQVASQTAENMRLTQSKTDFPILRPLVGMDKEDTIRMAKEIGSYEISILPYEDCCVLFSPAHPLLKAKLEREAAAYEALELRPFLDAALEKTERLEIGFPTRP